MFFELSPRPPFAVWESFYLIIGSAAAALTGLQFVVIAIVADSGAATELSVAAFGTPTILHFCTALLIAGILTAPWAGLAAPAWIVGAFGAAGLVYMALVVQRARRQSSYQPVVEDWVWYVGLPLGAYAVLVAGAVLLAGHTATALFALGAVALLLLFIGIRNAWDSVTYVAVINRERRERNAGAPAAPAQTPGAEESE